MTAIVIVRARRRAFARTTAAVAALLVLSVAQGVGQSTGNRVGIVEATGGPTMWVETPGDPRDGYLARIEWAGDGRAIAVQQLNRLQNRNDVLMADARTGTVRRAHRDESKAWVDVTDDFTWVDGGKAFLFDLMVYPNRSHSISEGEGTTCMSTH
jgi:hypothetical protein